MRPRGFITGALTLSLAACGEGALEPKPTVTTVQDETILTTTASASNTLILEKNTDFVTCTAPAPDATYSQASDESVNISGATTSDAVSGGESSTANAMPGRSPAVLITREMFFRTCEFSRNYGLTQAQAYKLYVQTMHAAATGWQNEANRTTVTIGESQTTPVTNLVLPHAGGVTTASTKPTTAVQSNDPLSNF